MRRSSAAVLEICCGSAADARTAAQSGADRVELCAHLEAGGVSPSVGEIRATAWALRGTRAELVVLVRPRPGDFVYEKIEFAAMRADVIAAAWAGAAAVAVGALTPAGAVDESAEFRAVIRAARRRGLAVVFHRAVDETRTPAAETAAALRRLGVARVLCADAVAGGRAEELAATSTRITLCGGLPADARLPSRLRAVAARAAYLGSAVQKPLPAGAGRFAWPRTGVDGEKVRTARAALDALDAA